jgi:hypothetical protein
MVQPARSVAIAALASHSACRSSALVKAANAKAVPLHATKALRGDELQLLLILDLGTRWGEWSASRPGRALVPGKGLPVRTGQEAGWAPGLDTEARGKILSPLPGIKPRSPGRPAHSQTLY